MKVRGVKRIGPKPRFAPIRPKLSVEHEPVATFYENHLKGGTLQDDDVYIGCTSGEFAAGDKRVHHPEVAPRRAPRARRGRAWTDEEDTQIIVMVKANHTIEEIAEEINRSWDATQKRITRLRKIYGLPYSTRKGRHK